jgi:hypothetical protein
VRSPFVAAVAGVTLVASVAMAAPASANPSTPGMPTVGTPQTLADGLLSPLSLEVDPGVSYVTQNFPGVLTEVRHNRTTDVYSAPGMRSARCLRATTPCSSLKCPWTTARRNSWP